MINKYNLNATKKNKKTKQINEPHLKMATVVIRNCKNKTKQNNNDDINRA